MSFVICSKEYKAFRDSLPQETADTLQILQDISKAIPPLANLLNIARFSIKMQAPASPMDRNGVNGEKVIFDVPGEAAYEPYIKQLRTGEKGLATFTVHPKKDHQFTDEEFMGIDLLINDIFLIAGRSRVISMIRSASMTDTMTGVANMAKLVQQGIELKSRHLLHNFCGLFLNLKNYKYINQSRGSSAGDMGIIQYAQAASKFLDNEEIFARLGGDNFFALVKKEKTEEFIKIFGDKEITIGQPQGQPFHFRVQSRMGIYSITESDSMTEVIQCSGIALNIAKKNSGVDIVNFTQQMLSHALHEKEISALFHEALKNKEFIVYYQPKVSIHNHQLHGCEALVRWNRNGYIVPPGEFLPVLEKEATICQLDFYVFKTICQDIRRWLDNGLTPVRVSSNFSKLHLTNPNLADNIIEIMESFNVDSKYIEIEITEVSDFEDKVAMQKFVNKLRQRGISVSIDDFGTGYSTLNVLKDLNVNVIKLDKSLLDHVGENQKHDEIVVKNMVSMMNELNLEVVAEGVENSKQLDFLRGISCSLIQGFIYDKPLPKDEFEKRLQNKDSYTPPST